ncbi:MAG: PIN domain-containing protein [Planctomycetota bacterium]|nr:MAG: PIN domain-containing protein [Planctomycetota bacterium]
MSAFVLDCSIAMAWCFEEQADSGVLGFLRLTKERGASVPGLWPLEVANTLLAAERRRLFPEAESTRFLDLIAHLPIHVDEATADKASSTTMALARAHGLTAYDAAYLELAVRLGIPLATRDKGLEKAAVRCGVSCLSSA